MLDRQALDVPSDGRSAGVKAVFADSRHLSPLILHCRPGFAAGGPVAEPQARLGDCRRGPELDDVNASCRVVCCRLKRLQAGPFDGPRISEGSRAGGQGQRQEQAA